MFLSKSKVSYTGQRCYATEASDLEWGYITTWPRYMETDLGNGRPLHLTIVDCDCWTYSQEYNNLHVRVYND